MAVRQLSAIYLAGASCFGVAIALAHHPEWETVARHGGSLAASLYQTVVSGPDRGASSHVVVDLPPVFPGHTQRAATTATSRLNRRMRPSPVPDESQVASANVPLQDRAKTAGPKIPAHTATTRQAPADVGPQVGDGSSREPSSNLPPPSYAELTRVTQRLRDSLTEEMLRNFELFLYVSKASEGPWAQHMYVFEKRPAGNLKLLHNWAVSTGREKVEFNQAGLKLPSYTPSGYYEFDPQRMYRHHVSGQWHTPMPFAMFFNWERRGYKTGLAVHAATGDDVKLLGTRASAGCVRLAPENARVLFSLVKRRYKGKMPEFAFDRRSATMSNDGVLLHDPEGRVRFTKGYRVLVFIEDFGGENVVAALY